jgi:NAD+ synthase
MKIAILQLNPTVGDIEGNRKMLFEAYKEAAKNGADLAVAPECVLTGYPLEDLVLRENFMMAVVNGVSELCSEVRASGYDTVLVFGTPYYDQMEDGVNNTVWKVDPKSDQIQVNCKWELPNYGVFDEKRVFIRNKINTGTVFDVHGSKIGVMICEDAWFPTVSKNLAQGGASFLISVNGSPFEFGKNHTRRDVVRDRIKETGLPFLYVNLVGGQDELVFDGGSFFYDGKSVTEFPYFETGIFYVDADIPQGTWRPEYGPRITLDNYTDAEPSGVEAIYRACVLGLRDYVTKQGFKSVLLGYSGGVDSGIVAALACDALGHENVLLVRLPSKFSSDGSLTDAADGAKRLGAAMRTIQIEPIVEALRHAYSASFVENPEAQQSRGWTPGGETTWPKLTGTADENIQARARGNILMAISNQEGHMLLTTGNKSEVSVGYSTLYGDMSGGFNPIKDCYKVTVWELCRWRNTLTADQIRDFDFKGKATEVVPEAIIVKPPSAELRPDQKDEDSLPPYPVLDTILRAMIEDEKSVLDIVNENGYDEGVVRRVRNLIDNAEYKRRQAAPGVKITSRLHGRERRYPIINKWRG